MGERAFSANFRSLLEHYPANWKDFVLYNLLFLEQEFRSTDSIRSEIALAKGAHRLGLRHEAGTQLRDQRGGVLEWVDHLVRGRDVRQAVRHLGAPNPKRRALREPRALEALCGLGISPAPLGPEELTRCIRADIVAWAELIRAPGITQQ